MIQLNILVLHLEYMHSIFKLHEKNGRLIHLGEKEIDHLRPTSN